MKKIIVGLFSIVLLCSIFTSTQEVQAATPSVPSGCKIVGKLSTSQVKATFNKIHKNSTNRAAGFILTGSLASRIPYLGPYISGITTLAGFLDGMKYGMWANAAANNKRAILYHCKPKYHSELNGPIDSSGVKFY